MVSYRSFYEAIKELPLDVQAKVYSAIFEYSLNFNEVVLEGLPKTIFTLIKPQLDANNKRFENGKKGGRKKVDNNQTETKSEPKQNQTETKTEPNNNVNDNDNDNVNDNVSDSDILLKKETKEENLSKENPNEIFPQSELVEPGAEERKKVAPKKERNEEKPTMPEDFIEIWEEWKEYRKAKRSKSYAGLKWEQMAVDKLLELSNKNPTIAKLILKQTYENSYQGFFPLKQNSNGITNTKQSGFSNNGAVSNGKVSGRSIVADRISQHLARNSESGNHTIDIEANIVR